MLLMQFSKNIEIAIKNKVLKTENVAVIKLEGKHFWESKLIIFLFSHILIKTKGSDFQQIWHADVSNCFCI